MSKNRIGDSDVFKELHDKVHDFVKENLMETIHEIMNAMPVRIFEKIKEELDTKDDKKTLAVYSALSLIVIQNLMEEGKVIIKRTDKK